jgi:hypothetical protein
MKTVFIRAIEVPVEAKAAAIFAAVRGVSSARVDIKASEFLSIPQSPFAYWLPESARAVFHRFHAFDDERAGRTARCGLGTLDDFRFLRLGWEVSVGANRWKTCYNGRTYSPFYEQTTLVANWQTDGLEIKSFVEQKVGSASRKVQGSEYYFREGFYFPRRTKALCPKAMPAGGIFSTGGQAGFAPRRQLLATIALMSSRLCSFLVAVAQGRTGHAAQYEVGLIKRLPWPLDHGDARELESLGRRAWSVTRQLDMRTETSHAFLLPALLQVDTDGLIGRSEAWGRFTATVHAELDAIAAEIDDHAYHLYGISAEDRKRIEQGFGANTEDDAPGPEEDEGDMEEAAEVDAAPMVVSLLAWCVGVAFGRFDLRLAIGERPMPAEPEPFDSLPPCSPGMLTGDDGLPLDAPPVGYLIDFPADGILVDDPGHPSDLVQAVREVFETLFDDPDARWHEATELLGVDDLRDWFARSFFEQHIKRYSRSRRKAPIYWQLATPSGRYSIWLYVHRATSDTLFRVLNDYLCPKLAHEQTKLTRLVQGAGATATAAQRREIDQQAGLVAELQALKSEVARVAPLWRPSLDDGVIINFAPLWRLTPQHRAWQTECRKTWDKLLAGDYDWSHLAIHLWPERVVPKCADDRSLAIAHGLEAEFWYEDEDGIWQPRPMADARIVELSSERGSTTVKAALKDLLTAPAPLAPRGAKKPASSKGARVRRQRSSSAATSEGASSGTRTTRLPDADLLKLVREAIGRYGDGASKSEVLVATGISDTQWNIAIKALLADRSVIQSGARRGARYWLAGGHT